MSRFCYCELRRQNNHLTERKLGEVRKSLEIVACIQRTSCVLSGGVSLPKEQAAISRFIATRFVVIEIGFIFLILAGVEEENPCS